MDMYHILLPIIQHSTDVDHEPHVYLYEDGMELWLHTVQCSPSMTPHLLDLFGNVQAILGLICVHLNSTCRQYLRHYFSLNARLFIEMKMLC